MGTKPNLNPSPISNYISNFLFCYFIYDNVITANEAAELRSEVASAAEL